MPTPPTLAEVRTSLGDDTSYTDTEVEAAYASEVVAQAARVRFPADPEAPADPLPYPADLAEALKRRVLRALTMKALPLGYQQSLGEFGATASKVGSDPEISRLEAAHRKLVIG